MEDIIKFSEEAEEEDEGSEQEEEVDRPNLDVKFLTEVLQDMRVVTDRLEDADLVMKRYLQFKRGLDDVLLLYKELHRNLQHSAKQLSSTLCFTPSLQFHK